MPHIGSKPGRDTVSWDKIECLLWLTQYIVVLHLDEGLPLYPETSLQIAAREHWAAVSSVMGTMYSMEDVIAVFKAAGGKNFDHRLFERAWNGLKHLNNPKKYPRAEKWATPEALAPIRAAYQVVKSGKKTLVTAKAVSLSVQSTGAGFGSPLENKKVELAAIKKVTEHFKRQGFTVTSVEQSKCGYDLLCKNVVLNLEWHVEVKGVKGSKAQAFLTANEHNTLQRDLKSLLAVVTNALSKKPTLKLAKSTEYRVIPALYSFTLL